MKNLTIDTKRWEFTHAKKPRGKGNWIFNMYMGPYQAHQIYNDMLYSEAKKKVLQKAINYKVDRVVLEP